MVGLQARQFTQNLFLSESNTLPTIFIIVPSQAENPSTVAMAGSSPAWTHHYCLFYITHNIAMGQSSFTSSIWNMGERAIFQTFWWASLGTYETILYRIFWKSWHKNSQLNSFKSSKYSLWNFFKNLKKSILLATAPYHEHDDPLTYYLC